MEEYNAALNEHIKRGSIHSRFLSLQNYEILIFLILILSMGLCLVIAEFIKEEKNIGTLL